jgi:predicted DNA-binding ribbon-helix-helix protein
MPRLRKRSLTIAGHSTSVSLEDAFWRALKDLAAEEGRSINALIGEIDAARQGNLSSAVRIYVLQRALAKGQNSTEPAPSTDS